MFPNARRGLRILNTEYIYLTEGAYSVVFVDHNAQKIRKLFRSREKLEHCQEVFKSEMRAYEIALKADDLKVLVPSFFGQSPGSAVVDKDGNDATSEFYPDLAYELEYIPQQFEKIGVIPQPEMERIQKMFRDRGINHVIDMSVQVESGRVLKAIDFAIEEIVPEADPL
jgi:hypothetical protein